MTRDIPYFDYKNAFAPYLGEMLCVTRDVMQRGAFILQRELEQFEHNLAGYLGVRHAIGVANCTDGLLLALRAAGVRPGEEVIFPSHTMVATASAIANLGATPVPVECGVDHLLDPDSARRAITGRTRAIMPVQLNGRTCAMDVIEEIAAEHGLLVVEDAAQALGSRYKGKCAGSFGVAAAFSFYPAKILGCLGDGGAVVTDDDQIAARVRLLRDHGRDESGEVVDWGFNSRLDNLQAAILDLQFRDYARTIERRRTLAAIYHKRLCDLPFVALPPRPDSGDHFDVFQNYEIEAEGRDALRAHLKSAGVGTLLPWGGKAVHQFAGLGLHVSLPRTERIFQRVLMLPLNTMISDDDAEYICGQINEFYQ